MIRKRRLVGFTLVELLVVILIIGILAAVAVPVYQRSVEVTKADDAAALVNMIGTANRMFALDHDGAYVSGLFPTSAGAACDPLGVCPTTGPPHDEACILVWCKYLANQNFGSKSYAFRACRSGAACGALGSGKIGAGEHKDSSGSEYDAWAYAQAAEGVISAVGGAPPPDS